MDFFFDNFESHYAGQVFFHRVNGFGVNRVSITIGDNDEKLAERVSLQQWRAFSNGTFSFLFRMLLERPDSVAVVGLNSDLSEDDLLLCGILDSQYESIPFSHAYEQFWSDSMKEPISGILFRRAADVLSIEDWEEILLFYSSLAVLVGAKPDANWCEVGKMIEERIRIDSLETISTTMTNLLISSVILKSCDYIVTGGHDGETICIYRPEDV